jgi:hypothetical protein
MSLHPWITWRPARTFLWSLPMHFDRRTEHKMDCACWLMTTSSSTSMCLVNFKNRFRMTHLPFKGHHKSVIQHLQEPGTSKQPGKSHSADSLLHHDNASTLPSLCNNIQPRTIWLWSPTSCILQNLFPTLKVTLKEKRRHCGVVWCVCEGGGGRHYETEFP